MAQPSLKAGDLRESASTETTAAPSAARPDKRAALSLVATPARPEDSDWSTLMASSQDGDSEAYRRLLRSIAPYLRRLAAGAFANPQDAEDAVQDILLTIHRQRRAYDPRRPFGPWLATIARRRIIDRLRRLTKQKARETTLTPAHETFLTTSANTMEERALCRHLKSAIDELPARQAAALRMLKLQEMSLKEASAASGLSIGALKVATHRGLKNLKRIFAMRDT